MMPSGTSDLISRAAFVRGIHAAPIRTSLRDGSGDRASLVPCPSRGDHRVEMLAETLQDRLHGVVLGSTEHLPGVVPLAE